MKYQDSENVNPEVIEITIEYEKPFQTVRENIVTFGRLKQNKENSKPYEGTHSGNKAFKKQMQIHKK